MIGDGRQFQWAELVRPGESRIRFERTSAGTSSLNAMFEHRGSASEWSGARLGWTGIDWALRLADGALARFRACGPDSNDRCSIKSYTDSDGHAINYRRNRAGLLERIDGGPDRWIAFDYDEHDRVVRAYASTTAEVRYEYKRAGPPRAGELPRRCDASLHVTHGSRRDGDDRRAGHRHRKLVRGGRCVRQVNRYNDE